EDLLVVRADCSGDPPFRELLGRVAEAALGAEAHALPLAALVRALGPRRDAARPPLVQVVLDLDEGPGAAPDLPGLSAEPLDDVDTGVSWYDLRLIARERGGGLSLRAEHRADLFEPSTVARLLERLVLLLEAAVGRPDSRLSELPLLGDDERRRILGEWNATDRERPAAAIPDRFEAQAARTPDAVAVGLGGRRLTYRQLDRRANALAARLAERGVGRETLVGVAAARTPEAIVAILAVLKAGGAYVPLDPSHPEERLRFLLQDTAVALVLAEAGAEERLRAAGAACLHLRPEPEADRDEANDRPPPRATGPFDLAYVLHTSGSTGRPKGVQIEHGAVVNHVDSVAELFGLGPGDRMLQFATLTFDVSVFEVFGALLTGARLCLASQETLLSPPDLTAMLREERVTMADLPPALLALLPEDALPDLRLLFVGLEPYPGDLVNRWARGGRRFVNGYGPTEATVAVTTMECVPPMDQSPPIGGPMANHRTYVLDRNGRLAPPGIPGELHIGGVGLARGYLRRPDQTAGRFVPDAFSGRPGARLYRTGDLVRQRPDGVLEFLGRIDQQVKLRGYRVELGEIESALEAHPGVVQAAVSLAGDEAGGPRLVAYVVPRPGERPPGAAELRELAGRRLPAFMVPAAFVTLERLPLTSSGKVDRSALPAPGAAGDEPVAPPATPTERAVAAIFAGLLGRETVGAHDDFFALGGTSLDAARLLDRVRERLGVALPLTAVLQAPGVAALSELIDAAGAPADASRLLGEVGHLPDRELDVLLRAALDEQ
ncbi:MAG TPA: amino acid adenylation domain-containing protein, partial [Candidatus Dormibacteraeota bacterium]|nr:amino acid adenylation domain-containing protein [Candidatus Dormibacteraeota bacterium]